MDTLGGNQEMTALNESGLYSLIMTSRKGIYKIDTLGGHTAMKGIWGSRQNGDTYTLFCLVAVLASKLHATNSPQSDKNPSIFNDTS